MGTHSVGGDGGFPSTIWPEVLMAGMPDRAEGVKALDSVLRAYHGPLRGHLERKFCLSADEASDYVQSFIEKKILQNGLLAQAREARGRFRTFLLTALDRFVISELRRTSSLKRAPQQQAKPLHELTGEDEIQLADPPSREFDLAWARVILAESIARMKTECEGKGQGVVWGVFESRLLKPLLDGATPEPYESLVSRYGFESPMQAFNVLVTAKRTFTRVLRGVVECYAGDPADADAEIRELRAILGSV